MAFSVEAFTFSVRASGIQGTAFRVVHSGWGIQGGEGCRGSGWRKGAKEEATRGEEEALLPANFPLNECLCPSGPCGEKCDFFHLFLHFAFF